jgi:diguanylate cyclase (GGDEF)-like protein
MTIYDEHAATMHMSRELTELLRGVRREGRARQMMATGLRAIMAAMRADGVAVIRAVPDPAPTDPDVIYRAGSIGMPAASAALLLWRAKIGSPALSVESNGRPIMIGVCRDSSSDKVGVAFWRRAGAAAWTGDDVPLADALAGIVWLLMDRGPNQRDVFRNASLDALTALLNQRSFVAEATRHIARLDGDNLPGTLMLAQVDNLETVVPALGADAGDRVLRRAASLLRGAVRPTDLVARTGDAEFAVWLSGMDHLTAAERAESLCMEAPGRITPPGIIPSGITPSGTTPKGGVTFSIGIATREPGESFADLVRRAGHAMQQVKSEGGGYWRVSLGKAA